MVSNAAPFDGGICSTSIFDIHLVTRVKTQYTGDKRLPLGVAKKWNLLRYFSQGPQLATDYCTGFLTETKRKSIQIAVKFFRLPCCTIIFGLFIT